MKSSFVRFLISYIIILLMPVALVIFAYNMTLSILEKEMKERNLAVLNKSVGMADKYLSEIDTMMLQLSTNPNVIKFANLKTGDENEIVNELFVLQNELASYKITNEIIKDFYIYFSNTRTITSPNVSYVDFELFYNTVLHFKNYTPKNWEKEILKKADNNVGYPQLNEGIKSYEEPVITYINSFPFGKTSVAKGYVIVLIDKAKFNLILKDLLVNDSGNYYVKDLKGNLLINTFSEQPIPFDESWTQVYSGYSTVEFEDRVQLLSHCVSAYNGWKYLTCVPYDIVAASARQLRTFILGIIIIILFIGLLAAYYMANHNAKPILELVNLAKKSLNLQDTKLEVGEYSFVMNTFIKLSENNSHLQESIKNQKSIVIFKLFDDLLSAEYNDHSLLASLLAQYGYDLRNKYVCAVLARITNDSFFVDTEVVNEINIKKAVIKEAVNESSPNVAYIHDDGNNYLCLVFAGDKLDESEVVTDIYDIDKAIIGHLKINVNYFVGDIVPSADLLYKSFAQSRERLENTGFDWNAKIIRFSEMPEKEDVYYLPQEIENHVYSLVKAGNKEELSAICEQLFETNFVKQSLSVLMAKQLVSIVRGIALRLLNQINIENSSYIKDIINKEMTADTLCLPEQSFRILFNMLFFMSLEVDSQRKNRHNKLIDSIVEYVKENFCDNNLSLSSLSARFDMSEVFISTVFKERTGENFINYITKARIDYAVRLLQSKDISVTELAQKCGYLSDVSFRRAFKRVLGVNPTEFKRQ